MNSTNCGNGSAEEEVYNAQRVKKQYHRHSSQQIQQLEEYIILFLHLLHFACLCLSRQIILVFYFFCGAVSIRNTLTLIRTKGSN